MAPGTAGSLVAMAAYLVLGAALGPWSWSILLLAGAAVAVYTAGRVAASWGKDPGAVVVDEGIGYLVTVAFLPHGVATGVAGLFLFRVLDIVKPPPARQLEALPGGWGIVADDIAAGLYGNLLLRLILAVVQQ